MALRPRRPRRAAGGEWPGDQAPGPRDGGGDHGRRDARRRRGPVGRAARVDGSAAPGGVAVGAVVAGALALVVASIPFIANQRIGILGVGLVNDDMAYHLLIADWLNTRVGDMPVLIHQGYPVGPHSLVAGLSEGLGTGLVEAFAGLTLAIPVLTALVAFEALRDVRPAARVVAAVLVAIPYLVAAYLAQEAFKEPIEALFLLSFALLLPTVTSPAARGAVGGDRRRRHIHVQLPRAVLARRRGRDLRLDRGGRAEVEAASAALAGAPDRCRWARRAGRAHRAGMDADDRLRRLPRVRHLEPQRRPRQPAPPALAARGARHLADERVPAGRFGLEPPGRLLPGRADRRSRRWPSASRAGCGGTARRCPRRWPPRSWATSGPSCSAPSTPAPRRSRSRPPWSPSSHSAVSCPADRHERRGWVMPALAAVLAAGHGAVQLPGPSPDARRADRPRRPAGGAATRSSRGRRCCSSGVTTSSRTSSAARGRSPRSATTTTPTTSSPTCA